MFTPLCVSEWAPRAIRGDTTPPPSCAKLSPPPDSPLPEPINSPLPTPLPSTDRLRLTSLPQTAPPPPTPTPPRSAPHIPAKAMMSKSLNPFIDDLFAFPIKMPLLPRLPPCRPAPHFSFSPHHRRAYRVDYGRVDEFGQDGEAVVQDLKKDEKDRVEDTPEAAGEPAIEAAAATATGAENSVISTSGPHVMHDATTKGTMCHGTIILPVVSLFS
ncbi:hypothetical protein jhhlp_002510 [Lomentospora prolificans]|uniref:Uncharacterized protein n=1 Tax=Lomentospora prolificans TaxID=41688 RepID=A0A2N3NEA1_9PEZI|nr:hypothetical protein jhhlp_002510 [Lomentospora prolificans]